MEGEARRLAWPPLRGSALVLNGNSSQTPTTLYRLMADPIAQAEAELRAVYPGYEDALVNNRADDLIAYFWDSPKAVRYGIAQNSYGIEEISEYRRQAPKLNPRVIPRMEVTALDGVTGYVSAACYSATCASFTRLPSA